MYMLRNRKKCYFESLRWGKKDLQINIVNSYLAFRVFKK